MMKNKKYLINGYNVRGNESGKCYHRVKKYMQGKLGLDIGCGNWRVIQEETCIGIDIDKYAMDAQLFIDACNTRGLLHKIFTENTLDYIFSSHLIEDFGNTEELLHYWGKLIKPGGYLIIYTPDCSVYPAVGQPGCSPYHKRSLYMEDVVKMMGPDWKLVSANVRSDYKRFIVNEFSMEVIWRKK